MGVDVNNGTEKSSFNKHKNKKILVEWNFSSGPQQFTVCVYVTI
jgi:hypothetical protein